MSGKGDSGRSYHLKCTGDALNTAQSHSGPKDLTLFGSCFCPFVQRVWVALEYLGIDYESSCYDDKAQPAAPNLRDLALIRLQADHVNRTLIPAFYRYLQAQDEEQQIEGGKEFMSALDGLVKLFERSDAETETNIGLWKESGQLGLADVMAGPWIFRATNVLAHYRGFSVPEGERFQAYVERLVNHPAFKKTCSTKDLYLESYER
ncbi:hypothetical protein PHLCEN_2v12668 [Hermanssonia centrifuga]|uniref:GST C-terminal domain-containing protein n=1 Tax=Hermanssonia centrifuga TaxID=98765 RepID=A0A2R6NGE3_9APHY|nr:hypothetical protein PHLCEN_2v12668 [Hermanssonia centrifuga]